jgi:serine/threonine-protein kinase
MLLMMLQIGDQFDHYQIRAHMAQGGMSDVYRAYDLLTGREVVLKIPDKMLIGDPGQYERFQREMAVMNTLHHPTIQRGLESGTYDRTPYLVTELVDGVSMRDLISDRGAMPPDEAVSLLRKVADGIAYCHANDVIHRDLKPENILVKEDGQPVVLDFGLALVKGGRRVTYANLSGTSGTPDYMAPEQIEGQRGDVRTDIYALGTILYELLAGEPPFQGDSAMAVMAQHLNAEIPRLDKIKPGVSPHLAAVVSRSLQRDPAARYADVTMMIYDLDHLDAVDTAILSAPQNAAKKTPIWRSPVVRMIAVIVLIIAVTVILALAATSLRPH